GDEMHDVVERTQMCAEQGGRNEAHDADENEHDAENLRNRLGHNLKLPPSGEKRWTNSNGTRRPLATGPASRHFKQRLTCKVWPDCITKAQFATINFRAMRRFHRAPDRMLYFGHKQRRAKKF